jgi:hypothetical protein
VPLGVRGEILDENVTLMNAAASGAALKVAAWLLKEKGFAADGDPDGRDRHAGETPLMSLVRFAQESPDSPRLRPFLALLLAHGAAIDRVSPRTRTTPLQGAISLRALAAAEALIAAGASLQLLTEEEREALETLRREQPPARNPHADQPGCVR